MSFKSTYVSGYVDEIGFCRHISMFDPLKPYNDLPPLPPGQEVETKVVLKRCADAREALAKLSLAGDLIPDQAVLINSLPLLEAKDSSEIENIVTTNDALFREASLDGGESDAATREALRYRTALYEGFLALKERPLSTRIAVDVCRRITGVELDIRCNVGTTLKNTFNGEVVYTPPVGEPLIRGLLANLEKFLNEPSDIDPVVRMAIAHYQFEAIHPFPDGNGRTGRILNILSLVQDRRLDLPTLYLSRHILRTKPEYYRLLSRVTTHREWEPWILYMLAAVDVTATWTNRRIRSIRALMDETARHIRKAAPNIDAYSLLNLIFTQPYCRIANVVERGIAKRQTASVYLRQLVSIGILQQEKRGRDNVFLHRKYLDLLASDEHVFAPYPDAAGMAAGQSPA
jgi:Fic family protein